MTRLRQGCGLALLWICGVLPAAAQTALPAITVTAPSPIVRPRPAPQAPTEPVAPLLVVTPSPSLIGALPIVTDQFATVAVVPNEELRRAPSSTLGDLLFSRPGITGSSFAPGASSRPIIRGLDVNRVGIVENGVGAGGVSDLGEDHFVPVTPLASDQVEVIRGPATLRYGSQSIGGVVSSTNNRIPDRLPCGAPCVRGETRGALTSVDNGREGGVLADAAAGNVAIHADAFGRTAGDYRIPGGVQPNSWVRTDGASLGGSYIFDQGFAGAAITQNNALYAIPGLDGAAHRTRIDARETKFTSKGEYRPQAGGIDAVRFWYGYTDYKHNELGLADPLDVSTDGVRQTFTNKEHEGRVELQLMPFDLRFAALTTALGVQAGRQKLDAPGDTPGPLSGLFAPNDNARVAGYIFNEFKFSEWTKAQIAGRIEHVHLNGTTPDFPADVLPDGNPLIASPRNLAFTPKSVSVGLIQNLPDDLVASVTAQRVERAPKPAELFSRGPHDATATFDIGNPNLNIEVANSVEVGLRRATGPLRFEATAYYTRFSGFIFRRLTGVMCDEDFDSCSNPAGELNQAVYSQRDAIFRGGELQAQYDVAKVLAGVWGVEGQFDVVRATFTDGTNVPRITPMRLGGGVFYRDSHWLARVSLIHAFAQNDVAPNETPTAGYNLLKAELSYTQKFANAQAGMPREVTLGLVGNNLLNEDIRNHVSYTKNEVLMPGAGVRAFANVKF
ncbi:MAG TPA: TonB-dependent receptor [Xanthobacteraceae bacterium]|nr:TonB-dependent receptor [Xanthobacteraceae bacterium]